ncbi:TPA: hypothetical protein ACRNIQ_004478 [Pseudomonas aeruginosa]|uniref:hypothetical protein n=1 Tax=Pseudomonas aeruginosa TaxID=287 RepID=UPI001298753A|nr:hypothetical protein [Pseudomonas aeruginosa]MBG4456773.1 hypothetical protein [Pseudomonas aeruginosa]MBG7090226.1 hypothetical protein [Pseudomonas aeruginosa]MBH8788978.1 hypothetical protein [Pseudomonas aeruginosa]MCW5465408.1 hypothetical protein [Pseudomonas aeruginosa]MWW60740.1 hypothetical protein [Pseudomonas aeruginosa]
MDANFSFLENWKFYLGIALVFALSIFITVKIVRNKISVNKNITATDGSIAVDGGINAPVTMKKTEKK